MDKYKWVSQSVEEHLSICLRCSFLNDKKEFFLCLPRSHAECWEGASMEVLTPPVWSHSQAGKHIPLALAREESPVFLCQVRRKTSRLYSTFAAHETVARCFVYFLSFAVLAVRCNYCLLVWLWVLSSQWAYKLLSLKSSCSQRSWAE